MSDSFAEDWETLMYQSQRALDRILLDDVGPIAEKILEERIEADIYDAYTPAYYQRRHVLEDSIESTITDPGTLFVTSTATAAPSLLPGHAFENRYPGAFLEMLEVGNMGFWRKNFPRPAVLRAQGIITGSSEVRSAIADGIRREFSPH